VVKNGGALLPFPHTSSGTIDLYHLPVYTQQKYRKIDFAEEF
jgi:hypothetical protein